MWLPSESGEAGFLGSSIRVDHAHSSFAARGQPLVFSPDGKWLAMTAVGGKEIALFRLNATAR